jgi:phytoene dehydrogenase-like protein
MTPSATQSIIIGAGINGLVAANYLARSGHQVTLLERAERAGGACVPATASIDGINQDYALGASVLGLMQDYVWKETGLAERLTAWAPRHPKQVHFPGQEGPTWIYRDPAQLDREFAQKWGERGNLTAFREDEDRVVQFLQKGYRAGRAPSVEDAIQAVGAELTSLWITGSAMDLLDHYLTAEGTKLYMAMTVTESGPVSLGEPYSAFTIPMMDSGSVFGSYYGFVRGGIWQITRELTNINRELGVDIKLNTSVEEVDTQQMQVRFGDESLPYDQLLFATDPVTAARLSGDKGLQDLTAGQRVLGSAGKLNLMFRRPVQWKHGTSDPESDTAFRFVFAVDTLDAFEAATLSVADGKDFDPGYFQIYCEGAAMRQMGLDEPFDRLAVFFKNLALGRAGEQLAEVEQQVRSLVLDKVANPEDCVWTRLLSPRDLQQTFGFPGGNLEHTMLVGGQSYFDRGFADAPDRRFYQFGAHDNISICGSSTYPCGSVAGTPGYMCATELLRSLA